MLTIFLTTLATVAQGGDKMVTIAELGDVLAKVNGKPVLKADVYPGGLPMKVSVEQSVKPRVGKHIDRMLVIQAAVAERLDKTKAYRKGMRAIEQQAALAENALLARHYESKLPATIAARNRSTITDAEAAAFVKKDNKLYRGKTRREAVELARGHISRDRYLGAGIDWMNKNLGNREVTINGKAIPPATIAAAIDAADRRYWMPDSLLLKAAGEMVVTQEAKATRKNSKTIREDTDRVRALIAAAEIEVAGNSFTLGNDQAVSSALSQLDLTKMSRIQPVVLELVKNIVMAEMARAEGVDEDEAYRQQAAHAASFRTHRQTQLLIKLYREKHLDAGAQNAAFETLVAALRDQARIEYLLD
jgi:hypothetical protein